MPFFVRTSDEAGAKLQQCGSGQLWVVSNRRKQNRSAPIAFFDFLVYFVNDISFEREIGHDREKYL